MANLAIDKLPASSSQPALHVPFLPLEAKITNINAVSQTLDRLPRQVMAVQPWPAFTYQPEVKFTVAHNFTGVFLKYYVTEEFVRISHFNPNDLVYQDSCVEFFISFGKDLNYYNLEFNALGVCRAGYGPDRENRILLEPTQLNCIQTNTTLSRLDTTNKQNFHWQLTVVIPVSIFRHHRIASLNGMKAKGNFYKCGDDLPQPHFLSWNYIQAPHPNFHLPAYFGDIFFE
ncbi:hypothetical protein AHMF7605_01630 [Adhaeribacter arboris]|uniref:Carbohydrate-binding domain-containing protein n=1 Tax=Adhaeribacter arboris TaxID=2072846 RepID=A0A2T2Y9V6_9BACT|nr:carbohydrate-binding family 9-like protein [Adhaeribacter arboris]PSR52311.1 hypothetical protein AHMF7605_01630 [Adhaeribacter arboris]